MNVLRLMKTATLFGVVTAFGCGTASALTLQTDARLIDDGVLVLDDPQTSPGGAIQSSISNGPPFDGGSAFSYSSDTGNISAYAEYLAASGEPDLRFEGRAAWSDTYTNTTGGTANANFAFNILGVELAIWDFVFGPDMYAGYEVQILLNGSEIWRTRSELVGGLPGFTVNQEGVAVGYDLPASPDPFHGGVFPSPQVYAVFDPVSEDLDLGSFADGESFMLTYMLDVWAQGPGFESGAGAYLADPNDPTISGMSGTVTLEGSEPMPISAPNSLSLLALALLAMAGFASRQARARKDS